ncbi:ABC transporter permease [Pseudonocardia sp.]|uniref:ABC transporter permease n=1 Tax=Pseudonocardia sp. TaxID=60912 RepID=UPI003D0C9B58
MSSITGVNSSRSAAFTGLGGRALRAVREPLHGVPWVPVIILGLLVLCAVAAPLIAPHDPYETDLRNVLAPPFYLDGGTTTHLLGTDKVGRDLLSRVVYGGRVSLVFAGTVLLVGGTVGTALGLLSGYVGGRTDALVQRGAEAVLSLPTIMVALVFVFVLGQSLLGVVLLLSPFIAASFARMVRGEALRVRESGYVALARVAGSSGPRTILVHLLPNVASTVIVLATLQVGVLILLEASLSFLGVGLPPPTPSWGLMVSDGQEYVATKYWLTLFPGLAIVLTVLSINWLGDWLRDRLDPTGRTR